MLKSRHKSYSVYDLDKVKKNQELQYDDPLKDDWDMILKVSIRLVIIPIWKSSNIHSLQGARTITYEKGHVIIEQGRYYQRICQISKVRPKETNDSKRSLINDIQGFCRIERQLENGDVITVGKVGPGESFGEISFIKGGRTDPFMKCWSFSQSTFHLVGASASVVADEEVEMFAIEGYFMNILIDMSNTLSLHSSFCWLLIEVVTVVSIARTRSSWQVLSLSLLCIGSQTRW